MRTGTGVNGRGRKVTGANLLSMLPKLGELLGKAGDFYVAMRAAGPVTPDMVAAYVYEQADGWQPKVFGRDVLADEGTRWAGARFLAGIVVNGMAD